MKYNRKAIAIDNLASEREVSNKEAKQIRGGLAPAIVTQKPGPVTPGPVTPGPVTPGPGRPGPGRPGPGISL